MRLCSIHTLRVCWFPHLFFSLDPSTCRDGVESTLWLHHMLIRGSVVIQVLFCFQSHAILFRALPSQHCSIETTDIMFSVFFVSLSHPINDLPPADSSGLLRLFLVLHSEWADHHDRWSLWKVQRSLYLSSLFCFTSRRQLPWTSDAS